MFLIPARPAITGTSIADEAAQAQAASDNPFTYAGSEVTHIVTTCWALAGQLPARLLPRNLWQ